jgi:glycosyltransferase involved in cell wall biosynthesis
VAVEAMASGLPVVVSDHAGSSEVISNGRDGFVIAAGDVQALVDAIERLVESADLRAAMGEAARRRVENENSWNAYGDAVLQRIRTA